MQARADITKTCPTQDEDALMTVVGELMTVINERCRPPAGLASAVSEAAPNLEGDVVCPSALMELERRADGT